MRYLLLCIALLLSWPAAAVVTPLAGASGQHNFPFVSFPNPIGVRVTTAGGAPAPGAEVTFSFRDGVTLASGRVGLRGRGRIEGPVLDACTRTAEAETTCVVIADSNGVATLPAAWGTVAGRYRILATARFGSEVSVGSIELNTDPQFTPFTVRVVSGAGPLNTPGGGQPIVVDITRPNGSPGANEEVLVCSDARFAVFVNGSTCATMRTDVSGVGTSLGLRTFGAGTFSIYVQAFDEFAAAYVETEAVVFNFADTTTFTNPDMQALWWGGPFQSGWGLSIMQHGERFFMVLFAYDAEGRATWFVAPDGRWRNGQIATSIDSLVYRARGTPYFDYDASRFTLSDPLFGLTQPTRSAPSEALTVNQLAVGRASLGGDFILRNFLTDYAVIPITPQQFAGTTASPITGLADMWWGGPSQAGWGIAIHEQFGALFSVWFTYDFFGSPIWFVMPGGTWVDGRTYAGDVYSATSSAFGYLGQTYNVGLLRVNKVGTYRYVFSDRNNATMHYDVEGHVGTNQLVRQPF